MRNEDRALQDLNALRLNDKTADELASLKKNGVMLAIANIEEYINGLRYPSGKRIRSERRASMVEVLRALYMYLKTDDKKSERYGDCSPSMRTLALYIKPELEGVKETDDEDVRKFKERAIATVIMYVQRSIKALERFGILTTHVYRAETNRNDNPALHNPKNPNFYYELTPVSLLCKAFAELIKPAAKLMFKLSALVAKVKDRVLRFEEVAMITMGLEPAPWTFDSTLLEENIGREEILLI